MKKKISLIILLVVMSLSFGIYLLPKNNTTMSLVNDNMLSFTVDGVESKTMPTKGSGYIASKITCTSGSIIVFDNDNYTIEVEKLENEDVCKIDFSKEKGNNTVTITTSDKSKIDSTSKTTTEGGKVVFYLTEDPVSITGGDYTLSDNKLTVSNITANVNLNITLGKNFYDQLLTDKSIRLTRSSFGDVFTTENTKTLYTTTENNITVYYFAGNALDNWVKFGGYYWRIIRTNADGSIRLLYHGTSSSSTEAYISKSVFNTTVNDAKYVGYMYGTSGSFDNIRGNTNNSTIKNVIDTWYENNLKTNYGKYLSTTAIYCVDRSAMVFSSNMYFDAQSRITAPSYDCSTTKDAFTGSNTEAKLTYPIALMTSDEAIYAGGKYGGNSAFTWYYYNSDKKSSTNSTLWWLLTPHYYNGNALVFIELGYGPAGDLGSTIANNTYAVRPVLSLKSCVKYSSGDGTSSNPYTILETSSGC